MDFHYDAFISYNHNPRDLMITEMLQRKLENFKIPSDVKSKSGKTKIERVFLDRGELEVAGNLSDSILNALQNTDKLIVICSPGGRESPWVTKEIDLFLSNGHTRDDILTVLTEGEPLDVIPERLLYKEVENEDGTITTEPAEPLSCDYRGDVKEANKTELPRLVAALIGCRYDDLVQRQKHYRMRQLTKLFAVLAAVMVLATSYLIWSSHKIRVAYRNNLIEQSKSLAIQSDKALESGDRIQAINYALEALPSEEEPDRPVVPEAEGALIRAIDLYRSPDQQWIVSTREFKDASGTGAANSDLIYSFDSRKYEDICILAVRYNNGNVAVWNADTGEQLLTDEIRAYRDELGGVNNIIPFLADDGKILLHAKNSMVRCLDIRTGEEAWRYDSTDNGYLDVQATAKDSVWISCRDGTVSSLLRLSLKDGKVTDEYRLTGDPQCLHLNDDGSAVVYYCYNKDEDHTVVSEDVYTVSTDDKEPTKVGAFDYVSDTGFTEDGDILVYSLAVIPSEDPDSQFAWYDYSFGKRIISADSGNRTAILMCYGRDGSLRWRTEVTEFFSNTPKTVMKGAGEVREGYIACTLGENLIYLDKSGKVVEKIDFGSPAVSYVQSDDGEMIQAALRDGSLGTYNFKTKKLSVYSGVFHGIITDAMNTNNSFYVVSSGTGASNYSDRLLRYNYGGSDTKWKDIESFDPGSSIGSKEYVAYDGGLCCVRSRTDYEKDSSDNRDVKDVVVVDIENDKVLRAGTFNDAKYGSTYYAGFDAGTGRIYYAEISDEWDAGYKEKKNLAEVCEIDIETCEGEVHYVEIPVEGTFRIRKDMLSFADGKVYIGADHCENYGDPLDLSLVTVDTGSWTAEYTAMKEEPESSGANAGGGGQGESEGEPEENKSLYSDKDPSFIDTAGKRVITTSGTKIIVYGFDGEVTSVLQDVGYKPIAVGTTDSGEIFTIEQFTTGSVLHIYDKKWKERSSIGIGKIGNYTSNGVSDIRLAELPGGEKVLFDSYNSVMLTGDYSSTITNIRGFKTFDSKTGMMIIGTTGDRLGTVPYRTLDEMIAEGHEAAGDS